MDEVDHAGQACILPPTGVCTEGWCGVCNFYLESRELEAIQEAGLEVTIGIVLEGG